MLIYMLWLQLSGWEMVGRLCISDEPNATCTFCQLFRSIAIFKRCLAAIDRKPVGQWNASTASFSGYLVYAAVLGRLAKVGWRVVIIFITSSHFCYFFSREMRYWVHCTIHFYASVICPVVNTRQSSHRSHVGGFKNQNPRNRPKFTKSSVCYSVNQNLPSATKSQKASFQNTRICTHSV